MPRRDTMPELPEQYVNIRKKFKKLLKAVDNLGSVTSNAGPLDIKTAQLIQLAAAAAIRSIGSVHSHTRRALEAGAEPAEIYHAIILLTSTIGFPTVSAALGWADDVINKHQRKPTA
jgi:4-carboxymuconolactone decarboxylase